MTYLSRLVKQVRLLAKAYWDIVKGFVIIEYWTHRCRIKDASITTSKDNRCFYCGLNFVEWRDEENR